MPKPLTLGIDIGGTGIKLGFVDAAGVLSRTVRFSTPSKSDPVHVSGMIIEHARRMIQEAGVKIIGIGVGSAGDIQPGTGLIRISPNLRWKNVPLKALLSKHLKYPIVIENDANAAAWAAYVVEAKRKVPNLICVTLGTGIGGGIVIEGKLYRGTTGTAGEFGHITLYPEGIPCNCGNHGCLERYVGARAMSEEARRAIASGERSSILKLAHHDPMQINPLLLERAAREGDRLAMRLWEEAGERLGIGLAALVNVLNPQWIVLAGGLSRARNLLLNPVRRTILKRSFGAPAAAAKLVVSKLDQDLGIVGAGLVAHELVR